MRVSQLGRRAILLGAGLESVTWLPAAFADGLPLTTFQMPDFVGSSSCAVCHTALFDMAGNDVNLDTHWRSTLMANNGKDPLWQAKVASKVVRIQG